MVSLKIQTYQLTNHKKVQIDCWLNFDIVGHRTLSYTISFATVIHILHYKVGSFEVWNSFGVQDFSFPVMKILPKTAGSNIPEAHVGKDMRMSPIKFMDEQEESFSKHPRQIGWHA